MWGPSVIAPACSTLISTSAIYGFLCSLWKHPRNGQWKGWSDHTNNVVTTFLSKQNSQDTYKTVHSVPAHSHASEKNSKLYTKLGIGNCNICHVFFWPCSFISLLYTSPVTAMVLLTQSAHLAVVVLQPVRKGWDRRWSLSFTNWNQVSLHLLAVFIPAFMYPPSPYTPHTTSTSLCNDTK